MPGTFSLRVTVPGIAKPLTGSVVVDADPLPKFSAADRAGARWTVLLAPREMAEGKVAVKHLVTGKQEEVRREEVAAWLCTRKDETSP